MISIILPTYNESGHIGQLIKSIIAELKKSKVTYEIIVVDDNSPDGTSKVVQKISQKNTSVRLIVRKKERGLATALLTGIHASKGQYVLLMDTDFSHPPSYVALLAHEVRNNGVDVVIASRYVKGGSMKSEAHRYYLSKALNRFLGIILGVKTKDLTGGFFIIKKSVLKGLPLEKIFIGYGDYFFNLIYALEKRKCKRMEVPFRYEPRKTGSSKTHIIRAGFSYISRAFQLRFGKY
jgi:dolichol-phosphate mannosyltransferase